MKAKPEQQSPPLTSQRFRKELALRLQRLVAESLEAWPTCENTRCRREKRCASRLVNASPDGVNRCRRLSPEEAKARLQDLG